MEASMFDIALCENHMELCGVDIVFVNDFNTSRRSDEGEEVDYFCRRYVQSKSPHTFYATFGFKNGLCQWIESGYGIPSDSDLAAVKNTPIKL